MIEAVCMDRQIIHHYIYQQVDNIVEKEEEKKMTSIAESAAETILVK